MTKDDRMLQLVLSDPDLSEYYEYSPDEYTDIQEALNADNPVVSVVAKIICSITNDDHSKRREVYTEIFNNLRNELL